MARLSAANLDERLTASVQRLDGISAAFSWDPASSGLSAEATRVLRASAVPGMFSGGFVVADRNGRVHWPTIGAKTIDLPPAVLAGRPFISDLLREGPSARPVVMMWVPVRDARGAVTGGLAGVIDLRTDVLTDLIRPLALGRTGHAVIVDAQGVVLAGTEAHEVFTRGDHPDFFGTLIREQRADVAHTPEIVDGRTKEHHVMAFVPLETGRWGLGFGQAEWEVFLHEHHLRWRLLWLGLVVLAIGLLAAWWDAGVIARPLLRLTASARAIAAGDLDTPVRAESGYELGLLAATMESMRASLARSREQAQQLAVLEERERIAHDLHDSIVQSLYGISLALEHAQHLVPSRPSTAASTIGRSIDAVTGVIQDIRAFVAGLHPHDGAGSLGEALERVVREFRLNTLLPVDLVVHGSPPDLPIEDRMHLQLLVREALANAARHGGASRVRVRVGVDGDLMRLTVADDGRGFDPAATSGDGLGLRTMVARAGRLGGTCTVHSAPGQGAVVEVAIPMHPSREVAR